MTSPTITATLSPPPAGESLDSYVFPSSRLQPLSDPSKTPLVLVACGSFSPITHMHLRMFEMAVDHVKQNMPSFEVIGGYLSPVSDRYNKAGLASALHRVRMCELACNEASTWLMVDPWEALQPTYQPTAIVLDHIASSLREINRPAKVMLLGGSDLLQTMSQPGVWSPSDLAHILGDYGIFVIERHGSDVSEALAPLQRWEGNICIVRQLIANDISSTRIRQFIRQGMSVKYLLPSVVIDYIREHRLYGEHEGFKETRSSSMPPLCAKCEGLQTVCDVGCAEGPPPPGEEDGGTGPAARKAKRVNLEVSRPKRVVRCVSAQRERGPSGLKKISMVGEAEENQTQMEEAGTQTDDEAVILEEMTRGRKLSLS